MEQGWSLTESDPGVFTGLLHELGVKQLQVQELYALDDALLAQLHPIHAFIFLFKWVSTSAAGDANGTLEEPAQEHYFARQVINNACASIALLNAALNIDGLELGEELANLKSFSTALDPEDRGWTISNSEKIRTVHNSFARSDPFHLEEHMPQDEKEDAYHFIAYMPIGDKLYELDGLKPLPVSHGVIPGGKDNWTAFAKQVIERRIASYPAGEVHFNLMALSSRQAFLQRQLVEPALDDATKSQMRTELDRMEDQLKEWEFENSLRRHNFIGLIHGIALELAKRGDLDKNVQTAKETMKKRLEDKKTTKS